MAIDEELLRPSREYLTMLQNKIAKMQAETCEKTLCRPDDKEYAREMWDQFYLAVRPMRREIEAIGKVIADYYGLQPTPPQIIASGQ